MAAKLERTKTPSLSQARRHEIRPPRRRVSWSAGPPPGSRSLVTTQSPETRGSGPATCCPSGRPPAGRPRPYDLVRIGGWALLIFGAVIVAFAVVRDLKR